MSGQIAETKLAWQKSLPVWILPSSLMQSSKGILDEVEAFLNRLNPTCDLEQFRQQGYTPLTSAIVYGNFDKLKLLHRFLDANGRAAQHGMSEKDDPLWLAIINAKTKNGRD